MDCYRLDFKKVLREMDTSELGLTAEQAGERLKKYGLNKLPEEEKISRFKIFMRQFASPLIYILLVAAIITALIQEYKDTGVIAFVIILRVIIGYVQEYKAEKQVRALMQMVVPKARVVRDGVEAEIDSKELVPGDIVLLTSGSRVPADMRLMQTQELRVEEAMLTGESVPADKRTDPIDEPNLPHGDQLNIAFMGTIVVSGRARGVVVATGSKTVLGTIAEDIKEIGRVKAPLQERIDRFSKAIAVLVTLASLALFLVGLLLGIPMRDMFLTAVAAAVATIPEGLPIVVTVTMAIGVARMARRHAIIRNLPAVETLGSTTVICSDKTGTLTRNEMTVKMLYEGQSFYEVGGTGYEPEGDIFKDDELVGDKDRARLEILLRIGLLCNESEIYVEEEQYKVDGDPTEGALIVSAMKAGLDPEEENQRYPQVTMIPFESERGYMATLHAHKDTKLIFVKGAPEKLLDLCEECRLGEMKDMLPAASRMAREGLRVLAMAYKEAPADQEELTHRDLEEGLVFAGLQGMIDPPREEAIEAVHGCKQAGIRVVMITGDHAVTAEAISRKLGITEEESEAGEPQGLESLSDEELYDLTLEVMAVLGQRSGLAQEKEVVKTGRNVAQLKTRAFYALLREVLAINVKRAAGEGYTYKVLTGSQMETMSDEELYNLVQKVSVFARVSPHHKYRITQQLMKHGEIVAVTGDGVNDAPALKGAHIGVAMGRTGTDVAKEASDMVIVDDNFASIFSAVREGRIVFDNIRKVSFFLIPTGIAAILSILATLIMGLPLPYLPAQLLWINVVTNVLQDIALAFEPGEKDVTTRPPRHPQAGIMTRLLIERTILVGALISLGVVYEFYHVLRQGLPLENAQTIAVTTMIFFQFFQAWNCRSEMQSVFTMNPLGNPYLFFGTIAAFGAHLAAIYLPALQWVFRMEPINMAEWLRIGLVSVSVILLVEIDKLLRRHRLLHD
jgi:magnesium-transporting ATPase (P-type)